MSSLRLIAAAATVLLVAGCTSDVAGSGTVTAQPSSGSATAFEPQPDLPAHPYYLSLGDSYPAGYQPLSAGGARTTRAGFPYQVVRQAKAKGYDFTLVNLACSGATTTSILQAAGCDQELMGPGAPSYGQQTQADAAVKFLTDHRGRIGLITISIGGNDILECGLSPDPATCLTSAVQTIGTNLGTLLARLRAAAGPDTRIVGTTYPDVFLGDLARGGAPTPIANLSVAAFKTFLNPQLARFYAAAGAKFVDVTKATGGYGSLKKMTNLAPYGRIPVPVADICKLTWYCKLHDVHPRPAGHVLIAKLVVGTLPRR